MSIISLTSLTHAHPPPALPFTLSLSFILALSLAVSETSLSHCSLFLSALFLPCDVVLLFSLLRCYFSHSVILLVSPSRDAVLSPSPSLSLVDCSLIRWPSLTRYLNSLTHYQSLFLTRYDLSILLAISLTFFLTRCSLTGLVIFSLTLTLLMIVPVTQ